MTPSIPRILIAGTWSGCGKSTVASGVMAALAARGKVVQPFKVGPDFIDPTHHTACCGRTSRNLDPFLMGEDGVRETFRNAAAGADVAVIEGVMGLYDGIDGTAEASTAHVARILDAPVLLVADVRGMSGSVHALLRGYGDHDPALRLAGAVLNRVGSPRHRAMIERGLRMPVLGWIPRSSEFQVESRHLGLRMAHEGEGMARIAAAIGECCDLGGILSLAGEAPPLPPGREESLPEPGRRARIGVARDRAFCFLYQDNLDRLAASGASPVFFSPLSDPLPDVDGVYLGGGYPELHAAALEAGPCREQVKAAVDRGLPVYGECGGLMYLSEGISEPDGSAWYRMAGVLPCTTEMTGRVQALGYVAGTWLTGSPVGPAGSPLRGHEFHYSHLSCAPDARFRIRLDRGKGIRDGMDGISEHSTVAGYTHAYFTREFAASFVEAAAAWRESGT
ncbi:MAG: cobyrinate a,c-diamide synthase [Methanomicrobiales archaeon]|nr:cobyrinate a,c-diamide synthase [Methanomicrobiales archaeon]